MADPEFVFYDPAPLDLLPNPADSHIGRDELRSVLDSLKGCYSSACESVRQDVRRMMEEPRRILRNEVAVIQGSVQVALDEAKRLLEKPVSKIRSHARELLDQARFYAMDGGIPMPTPVGIQIGLESGTELQSNWLRQLGDQMVMVNYPEELLGPEPYGLSAPAEPAPAVAENRDGWVLNTQGLWVPPAPAECPPNPVNGQPCGTNHCNDYAISQWHSYYGYGCYHLWRDNPPDPIPPGTIPHPTCRAWLTPAAGVGCGPLTPTPVPPTPVPPTPEPPTPQPPTVPDSCPPPPPTATQCQIDTASKLFGKTYDQLTTDQKHAVNCVCGTTADSSSGLPSSPGTGPSKPRFKLPDWCSLDISAQLDAWQSVTADPVKVIEDMLGLQRNPKQNNYYLPKWLEWTEGLGDIPEMIVAVGVGLLKTVIEGTAEAVKLSNETLGRDTTSNLVTETVYAVMEKLNRWVGFPPSSWLNSVKKTLNWQAPEEIPSLGEAIEGYLYGAWSEGVLQDYIRGNGYCDDPMRELMRSRRTRINVSECTQLYRQGKLTKDEWQRKLRNLGVLKTDEMEEFDKLVDQYPQPADLVRFMMRDAADANVVQKYKYMEGFEQKFAGKIKEYARAVGLNEDEAKLYWAAHWDIPSNTQLYEMLHRLRPGRVPKELEVTKADVREAIQVNDMAPGWVDKLVAISYHPINLTQIIQSVIVGSMKDDDILGYVMDLGYDVKEAEEIKKYVIRTKEQRQRSLAGLLGPKDYLRRYQLGEIGVREVTLALQGFDWSPQLILAAIESSKRRRDLDLRKEQIKGVRGQFMRGVLSGQDAETALVGLGIEPLEATYHTDLWRAQRAKSGKTVSAAQLCKAYGIGLISSDEYQNRLFGMGYSIEDVKRVAGMCGFDLNEKAARKSEQQRRADQRELERQRKEVEKIAKAKCKADRAARAGKPPPCE